ncbi:catalase [Nocardia sp. 2]|uniref:Catalase n=1 Tax=Nocardia acididurans TaxID=2802282 RepID=A0ABS1MFC8_9NOCA|nr:catalase [Nocardia acididurans]MBL1079267.1 catalase [Nocardia acididurans]
MTPVDIGDRLAAIVPAPPGQRLLHHRGATLTGTFRGSESAASFSTAAVFSGASIPVTARFSGTRGHTHDAGTGDQGLSVRFRPAGAEPTDLIAFTLPVFFVRTGAHMLEFLTAVTPASGAEHPEALAAFRRRHPESAAALDASAEGPPAGYLGQRYHAVHAFGMTAPDGVTTWVRFEWHPDVLEERLDPGDAALLPPDYLTAGLADRLPARLTLHARLPRIGDALHDPTARWADPPHLVALGTLMLETCTGDEDLDFDPLRLAAGITAPRDQLAADRSTAYRAARTRRRAAAGVDPPAAQEHPPIPSNSPSQEKP